MIEVNKAIERIIEGDPLITSFVGQDEALEVKVYPFVAPANTQPPFGVYQIIEGPQPEGTFHDLHSMEPVEVQITCWGRTRGEAWQMFGEAVNPAFENADVDVELSPYSLMHVRRTSGPSETLDTDTMFVGVPAVYRFAIAR